MSKLIWYAALLVFAVALYYGLKHMPASWAARLDGWKTNGLAFIAVLAPELSEWVVEAQSAGLGEYFPKLMQGFGFALFVVNRFTKRAPKAG